MKDSGVEWIGEVPEDWKCCAAKYKVVITHGCDPVSQGDIPVYGSGSDSFKTCGEFKNWPTVLIGRKGATLHIPHYIEGKYWNVDTAFDVHAMPNKFNLRFYYYCAICFDYKKYISHTTLPSMTQFDYYNMTLPVPPLDIQNAIVEYLERKCDQIDILVKKNKKLSVNGKNTRNLLFTTQLQVRSITETRRYE